jgi:hypothetical protein
MHDLWAHLHNEHGLTLVESEIFEIVRLAAPPVTCRTCQHWNEQSEGFGTCGNAKHLDLLRVLGSYMLVHAAFGCVMHESRKQSGTAEIQTPVAAAPGWQPIETAPKDGTHILAHDGNTYYPAVVIHWFESGWFFSTYPTDIENEYDPVRWMPLPTPPQA